MPMSPSELLACWRTRTRIGTSTGTRTNTRISTGSGTRTRIRIRIGNRTGARTRIRIRTGNRSGKVDEDWLTDTLTDGDIKNE